MQMESKQSWDSNTDKIDFKTKFIRRGKEGLPNTKEIKPTKGYNCCKDICI